MNWKRERRLDASRVDDEITFSNGRGRTEVCRGRFCFDFGRDMD